jgi:hypothetical protein
MNESVLKETINASRERIWEVLFNQYGDVYIHNPTMPTSNYMHQASKGELNCFRHCMFNDKLFVDEKITKAKENESVTMVVTKHNLPFLKDMSATYELSIIGKDITEVKMTSLNSFSPGFMKYLMRKKLSKAVATHLFGMKYYIETGKTVDKNNYSKIFKSHK